MIIVNVMDARAAARALCVATSLAAKSFCFSAVSK
jgi:hypothetical protein